MGEVATIEQPRLSLLASMASRYGMEPKSFSDTLRATVVPKNATNEEFAAFLLVAKEYDLNPITKEIYAFPKQGGGIQPIVSVDGWANLINSHPQCDGVEFEDHLNDKGDLLSITCSIFRKDRSRPTTATEYMVECRRSTATWNQWPRRMLRHKALIQAARYAFGFAGIVDPDEAERFTSAPRDVTPEKPAPARLSPPTPPPAPPKKGEVVARVAAESWQRPDMDQPAPEFDPAAFVDDIETQMAAAPDIDALNDVWSLVMDELDKLSRPESERLHAALRKNEARFEP